MALFPLKIFIMAFTPPKNTKNVYDTFPKQRYQPLNIYKIFMNRLNILSILYNSEINSIFLQTSYFWPRYLIM